MRGSTRESAINEDRHMVSAEKSVASLALQEPRPLPISSSASTRLLRQVLRTRVTVIGLVIVVFLIAVALVVDFLPLDDPNVMDSAVLRAPPGTPGHPLGTDAFGRDVLSRALHGSRVSLVIALAVVGSGSIAGSLLGMAAGYLGGTTDSLISRVWDVIFSFPGLILLLVIMSTLGAGVGTAILALTVGSVPVFGRLMRERVLAQRSRQYVEAARCLGASSWYIMTRHVLPNSLTSVLVEGALAIPGVILAEAALSYLGLGVPPPTPSWGKMISEGQDLLEVAPWLSIVPGFFILLTTLGFNLVGDGLRDFFDPTQLK